jgi:tRNA(adenine34) deaminase
VDELERLMDEALVEAARAAQAGEVPIGAVVVAGGEVVGRGFNQPISAGDPTAHAEVLALRAAARRLGNYRLPGATLYVTLEPCLMCVGAALQARVAKVVYGAAEPKFGALVSLLDVSALRSNHRLDVRGGVREAACREVMQAFFRERRARRE